MSLDSMPRDAAGNESGSSEPAQAVTEESTEPRPLEIWRWSWSVSQNAPLEFWIGTLAFVLFFTLPTVTGLLIGQAFDALTDRDTNALLWIAGAVFVTEMGRMAMIYKGGQIFVLAWKLMQTLLQSNMLAGQMVSGGPTAGRPVESVGEAISWFRDDPEDVADFIDSWLDVFGGVVFTVISVLVLGSLDWRATLIVFIPMIAVAVVTKTVDERVKSYRRADRAATAAFSGALTDVLAGATAVKVNDASPSVVANLGELADTRRQTAVRDRVLEDGIMAFASGSGDLAFGLLLVASAAAIRSGSLSPADLAVFATYLAYLNFLPRMIGRLLARRKQSLVSYENMTRLVSADHPSDVALRRSLPASERQLADRIEAAAAVPGERVGERRLGGDDGTRAVEPLDSLTVSGLSVSLRGGVGELVPVLSDVGFRLERGSFTVVTGAVGSGKTTLLRTLAGLVWTGSEPLGAIEGTVSWNGAPIDDLAAFMVPPRSAFLPQVPQLLSDSIADNVLLSGATPNAQAPENEPAGGDPQLGRALALAAVDRDVAEMADGVATMVGPRGLRLSGGQRQRVATARALARTADLLLLDDLSSALDVETELDLWRNLRGAGFTVLAVSHRPVALELADQVLTVEGGTVIVSGPDGSGPGNAG